MDTALLAKVQRAFIRMGLLHEDYEPGEWDAPTARAYVAFMRSRSIQRYPKQLNLNDTMLVRDIISVLSNRRVDGSLAEHQDGDLLVATPLTATQDQAPGTLLTITPHEANSVAVDSEDVTDSSPSVAGDPLTLVATPVQRKTKETLPAASPAVVAAAPVVLSERDKLLQIARLLSR